MESTSKQDRFPSGLRTGQETEDVEGAAHTSCTVEMADTGAKKRSGFSPFFCLRPNVSSLRWWQRKLRTGYPVSRHGRLVENSGRNQSAACLAHTFQNKTQAPDTAWGCWTRFKCSATRHVAGHGRVPTGKNGPFPVCVY